MTEIDIATQLRSVGFRATTTRVALLSLLAATGKPLSAPMIFSQLPTSADPATIYRSLHAFEQAGLVRAVQLQAGVVHYEYAQLPHHHHVVLSLIHISEPTCEECGRVEDVQAACPQAVQSHPRFATVSGHTLEYSGVCYDCAS